MLNRGSDLQFSHGVHTVHLCSLQYPAVGKRLRDVGQDLVRCVKQHTVIGRKIPNVS